ncbi:60S ribosome subunit biogenesis protein NIP7 like protein [Dictyocoela roeselum]|nr:60S ribosome subunit biogenesis protein NIP7 like protein [Dictyocoela roeselum]
MRELNAEEESVVTKKIETFTGPETLKLITANSKLYLSEKLVLLISTDIYKKTSNIAKKNLKSAGTIVGRFTRSHKFKIIATFLDYLAKNALNKVYVKNSAEMNVLYGNNVIKAHLLKIPENLNANAPVVIFNQNDVPLGFGITSRSSASLSRAERNTLAIIVQSDNGEYLRNESKMI